MTAPHQDTHTLADHLIRTHGNAAARLVADQAQHALHENNLQAAEQWIDVFRTLASRTRALHNAAATPETASPPSPEC